MRSKFNHFLLKGYIGNNRTQVTGSDLESISEPSDEDLLKSIESEDSLDIEKDYFDMACLKESDLKDQYLYREGAMTMNFKTAAELESKKLKSIFKVADLLN